MSWAARFVVLIVCFVAGSAMGIKWQIGQQAIAKVKADQAAKAKEQGLQASADKLRDAQNAQIRTLAIDLDRARAVIRLQHRASRPADYVPTVASIGASCSGVSLFAEDAEFLIGEAGRADDQRLQLEACQAQYNAAREALK